MTSFDESKLVDSSLYYASVPVFRRYLHNLRTMLALAATHPEADKILLSRIAPNMDPLVSQAEMAANFAVRCCAPLAGRPERGSGQFTPSYAGLRERIDAVLAFLDQLSERDYEGAARRTIIDRAGMADVELPGARFVSEYALPNFFFHLSMAYAILRQAGLPIGKSDFDGFHVYAA